MKKNLIPLSDRKILTLHQAGEYLGYSPAWFGRIYDKTERDGGLDLLKHVRLYKLPGKKGYRLDKKDIDAWLDMRASN